MSPGEPRDQDKPESPTRNPYDDGSVVNPYEADPEGLRNPWGDTPADQPDEEPDSEPDDTPRPATRARKAAKKK